MSVDMDDDLELRNTNNFYPTRNTFKSSRGMYGFECRKCLVCGNLFIVYTAHAHMQAKICELIFHKR